MRKLLILTVVLGMASMANAGLSLVVGGVESGGTITIAPTDSIWIGIYDDTGGAQFSAYLAIAEDGGADEAGGSWTSGNNVYSPPAIPGASNFYTGYLSPYGDSWKLTNSLPITAMPGIGLQADYEFHCDQLGNTAVIELTDLAGAMLDTLTINQIPEPITIALLGLGGLFLRRRK